MTEDGEQSKKAESERARGREREEGGGLKGQMKLVPSSQYDCAFYSVAASGELPGASWECHNQGLQTQSDFNITDRIVQGVTIDSDTAL